MIKLIIQKEDIDLVKFYEALGGISKLKEMSDGVSSEELADGKVVVVFELPKLYFRGMPFIIKEDRSL